MCYFHESLWEFQVVKRDKVYKIECIFTVSLWEFQNVKHDKVLYINECTFYIKVFGISKMQSVL